VILEDSSLANKGVAFRGQQNKRGSLSE